MKKKYSSEFIRLTILALSGLCFIIAGYIWAVKDNFSAFIGDGAHIQRVLELYRALSNRDPVSFFLTREMYPPLYHQACALMSILFRDVIISAFAVNSLSLLALVFSIYYIYCTYMNREIAFASAVITLLIPGVTLYFRECNIDLALASAVALSFLMLVKSEGFKNRKYTFIFFLCFAGGMLIKWAYLFFMIFPVAYMGIKHLKGDCFNCRFKRILCGVLLSYPLICYFSSLLPSDGAFRPEEDIFLVFYLILSALLTLFIWLIPRVIRKNPAGVNLLQGLAAVYLLTNHYYLFNVGYLAHTYLGRFWGGMDKHRQELSLRHFLLDCFTAEYLGYLIAFLFFSGMILFFSRLRKDRSLEIFFYSSLLSMVMLILQPVYDVRYFLPLTPFIAGFIILPFTLMEKLPVGRIVIALLSLMAFLIPQAWWLAAGNKLLLPFSQAVHVKDSGIGAGVKLCYDTIRKNLDDEGVLVVLKDNTGEKKLKPMVFMFRFFSIMDRNERIYLFREDLDLTKPSGDKLCFYYLVREAPSKDGDAVDEPDWRHIRPGSAYLCLLEKTGDNRIDPGEVGDFSILPDLERIENFRIMPEMKVVELSSSDAKNGTIFRLFEIIRD